jgi:hypothetical protein
MQIFFFVVADWTELRSGLVGLGLPFQSHAGKTKRTASHSKLQFRVPRLHHTTYSIRHTQIPKPPPNSSLATAFSFRTNEPRSHQRPSYNRSKAVCPPTPLPQKNQTLTSQPHISNHHPLQQPRYCLLRTRSGWWCSE